MTRAARIALAASAMLVMVLLCVGVAVAADPPVSPTDPSQQPRSASNMGGKPPAGSTPSTTNPDAQPYGSKPLNSQSRKAGIKTYDLSLTLPSYGVSGCMVCHGDPNLVRVKAGKVVSYFMDQKLIDKSAHAKVPCTGCHQDFTFTAPHKTTADWRESAKGSCKTCHQREWAALAASVHGPGVRPGQKAVSGKPKPLCGDCHGGHFIPLASKDPVAKAKLHASAKEMCGGCHPDYWANYDDYYHGAAYRKGAPDAPACWQCHTAHSVLPSSERSSSTNKEALPETCGTCHKGATKAYTQYAALIHKRDRVLAANPVYAVVKATGETISGAIEGFVQAVQSAFAPQAAKATTR